MTAKFIVIEGIDGSGKSTQVDLLSKWLLTSGIMGQDSTNLFVSKEPGGTPLGNTLRNMILNPPNDQVPDPVSELLMYMIDRRQHMIEKLLPSLNNGTWVLLDRHFGSTMAYQGYGRNLDRLFISDLNDYVVQGVSPDLTIWIDTPIHECMERIRQKNPDRLESQGYEFFARVQYGFSELCQHTPNWVRIEGNQTVNQIALDIQQTIRSHFASVYSS